MHILFCLLKGMYLLVFRCVEPTLVRNPNVCGVGGKLVDLCIAVWVSVMIILLVVVTPYSWV